MVKTEIISIIQELSLEGLKSEIDEIKSFMRLSES